VKGASPLRYPGGKWRWESLFRRVIALNGLEGTTYVEPYAGGASLALSLLINEAVSEIHLNDLDRAIFAFWDSVVRYNSEFVRRVRRTQLTIREWEKQKEIHRHRQRADLFDLGFATFFLNRTNRSGVLNAGVIGGKAQRGEWKIDARFNRDDLTQRIRRLGTLANRIHVTNRDAIEFVAATAPNLSHSALVYLDPPYFEKGRDLYLNSYRAEDHVRVRRAITKHIHQYWIVSYDDVASVRSLYSRFRSRRAALRYSARSPRLGREVLFFSQGLRLPRSVAST
jgi:DNA adenine methylase